MKQLHETLLLESGNYPGQAAKIIVGNPVLMTDAIYYSTSSSAVDDIEPIFSTFLWRY